jgi:hypothetical protein
MRWSGLACLAALPFLVAASQGASAPDDQLAAARKAVAAQRSLHYTDRTVDSDGRADVVADVGTTRGIQRISFVWGTKKGHVTLVVVGKTAYVRGDAVGLNTYMRFRARPSEKYAGVWLRIPSTQRGYSWVADDTTVPSLVDRFDLLPPFRERELKVGGRRAIRIFGQNVTGYDAWISMLASGVPLPIEKRLTDTNFKEIELFSRWNEELHVHAPPHSVALAGTGLG